MQALQIATIKVQLTLLHSGVASDKNNCAVSTAHPQGYIILYGSVQYYTIQRFTPALTGRKECRGTLFPASITGKKECRGTLFLAS